MTIVCKGTTGAKVYSLYKDGYKYLSPTEIPQNSIDKAEFTISNIEYHHAGRYSCQYQTHDGWSEHSESLKLVVTGERTHRVHSLGIDGEEVNLFKRTSSNTMEEEPLRTFN